jgi:cytohesin
MISRTKMPFALLLTSFMLIASLISLSTFSNPPSAQANYHADSSINTRNNEGNTPLNVATKRADVKAVRSLVRSGADPNVRDNEGNTPLNVAAKRANFQILSLLLQAGADPNVRDNEGNTPLNVACKRHP